MSPFDLNVYKDAPWLDARAPTSDEDFGYWDLNSVIMYWDSDNRPTQPGDEKDYFDTVEHNLNTAVYFCATAMNRIIESYTDCDCANPNQNIQRGLQNLSSRYYFLFSWLTLGTFSFLFSLGISKFMELVIPA